jgi:hypothetical protein
MRIRPKAGLSLKPSASSKPLEGLKMRILILRYKIQFMWCRVVLKIVEIYFLLYSKVHNHHAYLIAVIRNKATPGAILNCEHIPRRLT